MKQSQALAILKAGHSVFLTGQAGAGKTYVLNQFIAHLREHRIPVAITASTGIAATHMNGMTIHAWAGIGIKDEISDSELRYLARNDRLIERLKTVQVLIIDEVSMLHARQLDLVDLVLRHFRKDDAPFGGIQVVFSGDFFQLPPIGKDGETTKEKFAFMSKVWIALATSKKDNTPAIKVCYLSEQHRQTDDDDSPLPLNTILNQIRTQTITQNAINALNATNQHAINDNRVRLYTHNAKVHEINEKELNAIDNKAYVFESASVGDEKLIETLKKQVLAYETLTLKKGAKVMFIKNNPNDNVYNGTMGEVIDFAKIDEDGISLEYPVVRLNKGRELIVKYDTWSIDDEDGTPLASFSQIPLCLAWAITIHKSQGMTLDCAEIDLSKTFEKGQGYVALSRVKYLKGLKLLGLNHNALLLDDFAQVADRRFLTLSAECVEWFNANESQIAEQLAVFDKQTPLNYDDTPKKPKPIKQGDNTTLATTLKTALAEQMPLEQIAQTLLLAKMSTIGKIGELLATNAISQDDIAYLSPDNAIIKQVKNAIISLKDNGELRYPIKTAPIFEELRESINHQTIALSLLFIETEDL